MTDFPERDWRVLRDVREHALERFCERVLREIGDVTSSRNKTWHERYGSVYGLLQRRDRELADAFNGPRRSQAILQLARMCALDLLTEEELARFSPETRERLSPFLPERDFASPGGNASDPD